MKRMIAILLSSSMILTLAGCGRNDKKETKETKRTKDTLVTEESSVTKSESETESETETETDPPAGTVVGSRIVTPKDYPISDGFAISHTAKDLTIVESARIQVYGEPVEEDARTTVKSILQSTVMISFSEKDKEDYEQVFYTIQAQNNQLEINYSNRYSELLSAFYDNLKSARPKDYRMLTDISIFRADSDYISYILEQDYDCEMSNSSIKTYNFATADGREITFDDIVTDKRGFADFFFDYVSNAGLSENDIEQAKEISMDMVDESENAAPIEFLLDYDGIYIFYSNPDQYPTMFKIPAVFAGAYMDESYFGNTPECYSLSADDYARIHWDLEDDGVLEEIYPEFETDEYGSVVGIDLVVDGLMRASVPDADLIEGETYAGMKLMKTKAGFIVFLSMALEESDCTNYIFRYAGSTGFEFEGTIIGNFTKDYHDPGYFQLTGRDEVLGTGLHTGYYSIGNSAIPERIDKSVDKNVIVVAAKDIACKSGAFDEDRIQTEDYTIPAGTALYVFNYNLEGGYLHATTINKDKEKNVPVTLEFSREGDKTFFNGEDQDDVFYGIRYAG